MRAQTSAAEMILLNMTLTTRLAAVFLRF